MISVLILTKNEEVNLAHCLDSVKWSNDIVVLDSFSIDKTLEIAKINNARIEQRQFDDYSSQRNYGLHNIEYRNEWLLMIDADEYLEPQAIEQIENTIGSLTENYTLIRLRRKDYFLDKWIKHASGYPTWFGRIVKPKHVEVKRSINEEFHTEGKVAYVNCHLLHYPFRKGISAWVEKHNRYSTMEAELLYKDKFSIKPGYSILNTDPVIRRRALKKLVYGLPGRPLIIFILLYILRGGFLDGRAGLTFCILRSYYELLIDCKLKELELNNSNK